jgi:hypothetical protein
VWVTIHAANAVQQRSKQTELSKDSEHGAVQYLFCVVRFGAERLGAAPSKRSARAPPAHTDIQHCSLVTAKDSTSMGIEHYSNTQQGQTRTVKQQSSTGQHTHSGV